MKRCSLLLICLLSLSMNGLCQSKPTGEIIIFKGNKFEMREQPRDTIVTTDADGSEIWKIIAHDPIPAKMNSRRIYRVEELTTAPAAYPKKVSPDLYIVKGIDPLWDSLPDGLYHLDLGNIVVDEQGKIVFYSYSGCSAFSLTGKHSSIGVPGDIQEKIDKKVTALMNSIPLLIPGKVRGKSVLCLSGISAYPWLITVRDHVATRTIEDRKP